MCIVTYILTRGAGPSAAYAAGRPYMHKLSATLLSLALFGAGAALLAPVASAHSCSHSNLLDAWWCDAHYCSPWESHYHSHRPLGVGPAHYCWVWYTGLADGTAGIPIYGVEGGVTDLGNLLA